MSVRGLLVFAHVESTSRLRRRRGVTDYVIRVYVCVRLNIFFTISNEILSFIRVNKWLSVS